MLSLASSGHAVASAVPAASSVGARARRKSRTRQALGDAALALIGQGRTFSSLSLREVTHDVGVVPASFYRHFHDMEELGLEMVEGVNARLRPLMRNARRGVTTGEAVLDSAVRQCLGQVDLHRAAFTFFVRERFGGVRGIREAIARELNTQAGEVADLLAGLPHFDRLPRADLLMIGASIVGTVVHNIGDVLDLAPGHPDIEGAIARRTLEQIRLVVLGGVHWRPGARIPDVPLPALEAEAA